MADLPLHPTLLAIEVAVFAFLEAKLITARFYAEQILPQAAGLLTPVTKGAGTVMALTEEQF